MSPQVNNEKSELDQVFAEPGQVEAKVIERPIEVEDEHLTYLDELRASGDTNMYGARPYLANEFGLDNRTASVILTYWMESFAERHPVNQAQTV